MNANSATSIRVHARAFAVFLIHCKSHLGLDALTEAANCQSVATKQKLKNHEWTRMNANRPFSIRVRSRAFADYLPNQASAYGW
jgi:hypothetical protein